MRELVCHVCRRFTVSPLSSYEQTAVHLNLNRIFVLGLTLRGLLYRNPLRQMVDGPLTDRMPKIMQLLANVSGTQETAR